MVQVQDRSASTKKPEAHLAINKNRIKKYDKSNTVPSYYLEDGQQFQIELHNPRKTSVLAMIQMNGRLISKTGVVLRPGERVFLDRFIDDDKKLKFDTYEIPDEESSKEAIADNGKIEVFFYEEKELGSGYVDRMEKIRRDLIEEINKYGPRPYPMPINPSPVRPFRPYPDPWFYWDSGSSVGGGEDDSGFQVTLDNHSSNSIHVTEGSTTNYIKTSNESNLKKVSFNDEFNSSEGSSIETGRVEKGDESDQKFESIMKEFNDALLNKVEYQIYPASKKPATAEEEHKVRKYCYNCGKKKKPTFNFCPYCGEKQD